jgi:acyl-CoA thioester hydrolase
MYVHETTLRVRYGETDTMGYVYYGNYASYYEVARTEMVRELGLPYSKMEEEGTALPVIHLECRFIKPARYDDMLTIKTYLREMPTARITFDYEVFNENGDLLNKGASTLVFTNRKNGRPTRPPEALTESLKPYFEQG